MKGSGFVRLFVPQYQGLKIAIFWTFGKAICGQKQMCNKTHSQTETFCV